MARFYQCILVCTRSTVGQYLSVEVQVNNCKQQLNKRINYLRHVILHHRHHLHNLCVMFTLQHC